MTRFLRQRRRLGLSASALAILLGVGSARTVRSYSSGELATPGHVARLMAIFTDAEIGERAIEIATKESKT